MFLVKARLLRGLRDSRSWLGDFVGVDVGGGHVTLDGAGETGRLRDYVCFQFSDIEDGGILSACAVPVQKTKGV